MNFYKLSEALENPECEAYIPPTYAYIFDNLNCEFCGAPLVINENRTIVRCNNDNCYQKLGYSILKITRKLGIKGLGGKGILAYVMANNKTMKEYEEHLARGGREYTPTLPLDTRYNRGLPAHWIRTRVEFLKYPPVAFKEEIDMLLAVPRTYADAVALLNIPDMVERARALFDSCDSYDDFLAKVKPYGGMSKYIQKCLVKKRDAVMPGVLLARVLANVQDLKSIPEVFNIIPSSIQSIKMYITGNIIFVKDENGNGLTKSRYVERLNQELYKKGSRLVLKSGVTRDTAILVSDSQSTGHYADAVAINRQRALNGGKEKPIVICTSAELAAEVMGTNIAVPQDALDGAQNTQTDQTLVKPQFEETNKFI